MSAETARPRTPLWARIPGPFFFREVRASGRRSSTYWTRCAYAAMMLGFVVLFYLVAMAERTEGVASQAQQMQTFAPTLTMALAWVQFALLWLIAASMTAPTICDEVRAGTLTTLLTTPLKAWEIVLGKLLGSLVQLAILTLMGTPLLLAIRVFGGVIPEMVVALTAIALSTAVMSASLGLLCSVYARRPAVAISSAVFLGLGVWALPMLTMLVMNHYSLSLTAPLWSGTVFGIGVTIPSWFEISAVMCAPFALGIVTFELGGAMQLGSMFNVSGTWIGASLYAMTVGGVALTWASLALRRRMAMLGRGHEASRALPRGDASPSRSRVVGEEPVLWRELRASGGARWVQISGLVLALGLLVLAFWLGGVDEWEVHMVIGLVGTVAAMALAAVHSAGGITGEREARTWEVLLTSPLSARQIIMAKFVGAVRRQWLLPGTVLLAMLVMGVGLGVLRPVVLLHYGLTIGPAIMAICAMGVFLSLTRKKTAAAASLNVGVWLGVWILLPMVCGIVLIPLVSQNSQLEDLGERVLLGVLTFNPAFQTGVLIEGSAVSSYSSGYETYDYGPRQMGVVGYTGACLVGSAAWVIATGLILELARRSLARRSQRRW